MRRAAVRFTHSNAVFNHGFSDGTVHRLRVVSRRHDATLGYARRTLDEKEETECTTLRETSKSVMFCSWEYFCFTLHSGLDPQRLRGENEEKRADNY